MVVAKRQEKSFSIFLSNDRLLATKGGNKIENWFLLMVLEMAVQKKEK